MEELPEDNLKQASEVQNIQIADGDVPRGTVVPLFMVFPRYFSCPTQESAAFKIGFEVNICVVFVDNHSVSIGFPMDLYK